MAAPTPNFRADCPAAPCDRLPSACPARFHHPGGAGTGQPGPPRTEGELVQLHNDPEPKPTSDDGGTTWRMPNDTV